MLVYDIIRDGTDFGVYEKWSTIESRVSLLYLVLREHIILTVQPAMTGYTSTYGRRERADFY